MPSFLAAVAGFMDWDVFALMSPAYPPCATVMKCRMQTTSRNAGPDRTEGWLRPGVTPGKWTRRWSERLPDVPLTAFQCAQDDRPPSCATAGQT